MKRNGGIIVLLGTLALLSSCIILAKPDTGKTILTKPGEKTTITVISKVGPFDIIGWQYRRSDGTEVANGVGRLQDMGMGVFEYTPAPEDIGRYTLNYQEINYIVIPSPCQGSDCPAGQLIPVGYGSRTWSIEICGVTFTDLDSNIIEPGTTQEFKAKVWPEGSYTYQWYLDGLAIGTGETFQYNPDRSCFGSHTIELRAVGSKATYTYARKVFVPLPMDATIPMHTYMASFSLQATSDGGYILGIESYSPPPVLVIGPLVIIKMDSQGVVEWQKEYNIMGNRDDYGIIQVSDGGYVIFGTSYATDVPGQPNHGGADVLVIKTDAQGNIVWQGLYGTENNDSIYAVEQTRDDGLILAGQTSDIASYDNVPANYLVIKLNSLGIVEWQRDSLESSFCRYARAVRQTIDGGYIVVGNSDALRLSPHGDVVWQTPYGGGVAYAVLQDPEGGYVIAGTSRYKGGDDYSDCYVEKLDPEGVKIWDKSYGGMMADAAYAMQACADGGYVLAGTTRSYDIYGFPHQDSAEPNGYIVKIDAGGTLQSQKIIGSSLADEELLEMVPTLAGERVVAGYQNNNMYLFKLDANGN